MSIMMNRSTSLLRLKKIFLLLLACTQYASEAFNYEPPGKDPASIDKVRNSEKAIVLTSENFDELTEGKIVFIKVYSPFCPHCKEMAAAWNELAAYYDELPDSDDILIGSIDCTDSPNGKQLCTKLKIVGLPTLFYGSAYADGVYLEEYGGDKEFKDLKSFAAEALVPKCNPGSLDACSSDDRAQMENFMAMSYTELDALIKAGEKNEKEGKKLFKEEFDKLQKVYDESLTEKELKVAKGRANIKLIKEVAAAKTS